MTEQEKIKASNKRMINFEKKLLKFMENHFSADRKITDNEVRYVMLQTLSRIELEEMQVHYKKKETNLIMPKNN